MEKAELSELEHSPRTAGEGSHQRGGWGWLLLPALLIFLVGQLVFGMFMMRLADYEAAGAASLAVLPVTLSVLQLLLLWIAWRQLRVSRTSVRNLVGFERGRLSRDLGLGVVLAGAASAVVMLSLLVMEQIVGEMPVPFPTWAILWWTTIGAVTAGIGEELYFRGFLFERLGRLSAPALLVVTSLAFALIHAPPMYLHTFLVSLGFGWVYLRTKRLFPLVLGHTFTNVVGGLVFLYSS